MKLYGIAGKGTGRVGSQVFAISGGEQIVRQYNPVVSNPSTEAQVEQRAKLKLMSQIAAALAPAIAFKKKGLVSARNQFVSANIGKCSFEDNEATFPYIEADLTGGSTPIPSITATLGANNSISVALGAAAESAVGAVVYVSTSVDGNDKIQINDIKVVTTAGEQRTFAGTLSGIAGDNVLFAYGVKNLNSAGGASYGNYVADGEAASASLTALLKSIIANGTPTATTSTSVAP